jgi:CO/xanthine dehydrogenase Mo-binding subunit
MTSLNFVGKRIPRIDAEEKVSGRSIYINDLKLPGMLHGKILYSRYPHAKILEIDTSKAKKLKGVKAVLTGRNIPPIRFGFFQDNTPLKGEKVLCRRDEIAAVAAVEPEVAEEALDLIEVDYEPLPAVFNPESALAPGAPLLYEERGTNLISLPTTGLDCGNVEEGRRGSRWVAEGRFEVTWVTHCCLGTSGCIAAFDGKENLLVYTNTQIPSYAQKYFRDALATIGLLNKKVRIIQTTIGGAFGSKLETHAHEYIAILLAHESGRPVKILFSREEEFMATSPRQPASIYIAQGCDNEGRLTFRDIRMLMDAGARGAGALWAPTVMMMTTSSLYRVPNVRFRADFVHTNNTYCQAMRGYGNPQVTFAVESQMDMLAEEAGIHPVEFRLINANQPGETTPQNLKITTCGLKQCIEKVSEALDWEKMREQGRGVGMASLIHVGGGARIYRSDGCGTIIKMDDYGRVDVFTGATDMGQGSETVLAQIVAEELGLSLEDVNIVNKDTNLSPWDVGAHASRTTFIAGNSALLAAKRLKSQILEVASEFLQEDIRLLELGQRRVFSKKDSEKKIDLVKLLRSTHFSTQGRVFMAEAFYDPPNQLYDRENKGNISATYAFGSHGVEVEVDKETGQVKILKYVAAHDVGSAINPLLLEGQIYGGVVMGAGYALTERLISEGGEIKNPNFHEYKILTPKDSFPIETILIETEDPEGPFNAKGVGEPGVVPSAPAIANAIYDAVGVRIKDLPITPEKVLAALKKKGEGR